MLEIAGARDARDIMACQTPGMAASVPTMWNLAGRNAVITGAGRGIGEAIARVFVEAGANVAVVSRTESNSRRVAEALEAIRPGSAKPYALDVADFAACQAVGQTITADFGDAVDIVINNAGITRDGLLLRMKEDDWDAVLDTNLKGAFNMVKAFQRQILRSKNGRIINVSSVIGLMGNAGQSNYAASKAGLIGFTKSLAREFSSRGVTANCIAPGFIVTDMTSELPEALQTQIKAKIPLGTFGRIEDIAAAALYLAADSGRYVTGQVLTVDGGMVM
jgi:3-oxoacyl-[acyl-carrier protein] reductase